MTTSLSPDFIQFLFSNKPKFDCYFEVGNGRQGSAERIGAVKLMLMAHSEVFRVELEFSELKEKNDVPIKDIYPETFKGMLRYVYGNDTTQDMGFDEADNLLYVAEKYMMKTLKDKLATRLMKLLNTNNICALLNNPACHRHLELDSAITDILRYETDRVLASPQFVWMNADGFLRILEQDGVAVPEIELWRAAIRWAKHRANSEDGQQVRQQLSGLTRHLRPCTLTADQVCGEIADTRILTREEIGTVCLSLWRKEQPQDLIDFSNETEPRKILGRKKIVQAELGLINLNGFHHPWSYEYCFTLKARENSIELLPVVCRAWDWGGVDPEDQTCKVECTTTVTKVANATNPDSERSTVLRFSEDVKFGADFEIPLAVDGKGIVLLPETEYRVEMVLNGQHRVYTSSDNGSYWNNHLTLIIQKKMPPPTRPYRSSIVTGCAFPSTRLRYKVVPPAAERL